MFQLIEDINAGKRTAEIVEAKPNFAFKVREIDTLRQTLLIEHMETEFRKLEVSYLFGATNTGKTMSIYQQYEAKDICRITHYRRNTGVYFDSYNARDVLVFEEFASQIAIEEMLNYLDIYPLRLPARYNDKIACYTKVFITANIPLEAQYVEVQNKRKATWKAFLRRIHKVLEFRVDGTVHERIVSRDLKGELS